MIDVKRYPAKMFTPETPCVHATDYDAAQSELAALREERSSLVASDIRKNGEVRELNRSMAALREELAGLLLQYGGMEMDIDEYKQRLADTDRRNAALVGVLLDVQRAARKQAWAHGYPTLFEMVDAALSKPEEAKS